jgi:parallel beta-helix repeat protein
LVRSGIYRIIEPLILGPEDSGTESSPFTIRAYGNEHPILSGCMPVTGFTIHKGRIYKVDLKSYPLKSSGVRQLFANGKRQILARYPNFDPLNPVGGGFLYVEGTAEEGSKSAFKYQDGSLHDWANTQDATVFIFSGPNYGNSIVPILGIDRNTRVITLSQDARNEIISGNRYFFQNLLEELDSPGEWYFDRQGKILYYWPADDAALGTVAIPVLTSILEIKGKNIGGNYSAPSYIRFEGFTLEGCEGSAVVISGAKGAVIARSTIYNVGGNGIEIQDGFENAAVGNDIYDTGGTGITIYGGIPRTLTPANNRAENNHIYNTGVFAKGGASGIRCNGVGNTVSHNLIHSMPRVGIWFDGNDHLVEYNHVHHVNQETQDSGIIYSSQIDWTKRGTIIRYNHLHDSGGYGRNKTNGAWQTPYETYGIYLDDWTSGTNVYGNIVTKTTNGGIFIHGGRDNIVENNVIIEGGRLSQMVYSGWPITHPTAQQRLPKMYSKVREMSYTKYPLLSTIKDVNSGATMSGNRFLRNIIFYTGKESVLYGIFNDIDLTTTVSDYNIIFHGGLPLLVHYTKMPGKEQWMAWQKMGLDRNSLIADPLFSDVAKEDFSLSSASPALKIGFKPIPFEKIGQYKDPMRASWPIKE